MRSISFPFAALALAACATLPAAPMRSDGLAHLGEATRVGTLVVTPRAVVEDSRCPINARCVWAGRLVLATRIGGAGMADSVRNFTLGEPQAIAGGTLALVAAEPGKMAGATQPAATSFTFAFQR